MAAGRLRVLRPFRIPVLSIALLLLTWAAAGQTAQGSSPGGIDTDAFCKVGRVAIHADFEAAALHACSEHPDGPVLTIAPEYAPINPSPWYAYRLVSESPGPVTITHRYRNAKHRYAPWTSTDGGTWTAIDVSSVETFDDDHAARFTLNIPPGGLYVTAQPLVTNADMERWIVGMMAQHDIESEVVARTPDGRDVALLLSRPCEPAGLIVLLGRQHPPEVTGAFAFMDFAERLFEDDETARGFRERYRLALVPVVNPDGVAAGHWRLNERGVDLNRDWGPFTQPETRGVADWLATAAGTLPLTLLLDFHSTWSDVFYAPHDSDDPSPTGFGPAWRERMAARLGEDMSGWSGAHNPGLPTAKSWARRAYGITAITYEVGDGTPRDIIRTKARVAAEEMMKLLLQYSKE